MDRRTCLALLSLLLTVISIDARAAVGRTPGTFNVSPTGAATYSIPIWAPPGPRGIQPALSLIYNSQSGAGTLGVGWSLAGLGSIDRCNKTYAQDTTPAAVALVTSDGYCLNGNRLRLTGGTYGTAGSTYQTEIANFSNVTANGSAGNGPAYFTVQGKDGLTYQYGYTDGNGYGANSQVLASGTTTAVTWLLSKVTDRAGNSMAVNYIAGTSTAVPGTIYWTPSSAGASTYNYQMNFTYTTNNPQTSVYGYVAGAPVTNVNLLTDVTVTYSGTTVKKYVLTYQTSSTTGRNELQQVQECADSGATNCLSPTTITYQSGAVGLSSTTTTILSNTQNTIATTPHADFNGDGYPDLYYSNGTTVYVVFGSASGYSAPASTGISASAKFDVGDVLGTGKDGFLVDVSGTYWYYTWNGTSFTSTNTGVPVSSYATQSSAGIGILYDVDGDGLPDIVTWQAIPSGPGEGLHVQTQINTSSGGVVRFSSTINAAYDENCTNCNMWMLWPDTGPTALRRWDFNGDGRGDLLFYRQWLIGTNHYYGVRSLISQGTTFLADVVANGNTQSAYYAPIVVNWNNDACSDVIWEGVIYISGCDGSSPQTAGIPGPFVAALDWNGDGRTDLLVANGSTIGVYESTGTGATALIPTSIPYSSTCSYFVIDANGDGQDGLGCWSQAGTHPVFYYPHNGAGIEPDLATSFVDGYGNSASPTYSSLAQSPNPYLNQHDAAYPYETYIGPLYVVVSTTFSDPSNPPGGTYSQTVDYYGPWMNLQGRGFAGFESQAIVDSRTPTLRDVPYYQLKFPYTGMLISHTLWNEIASNQYTQVHELSTTITSITLDNTTNNQRYFPYNSNITTQIYELGGAENSDLITTASTNYTYDNYGNATTVATTVTDNDPGSPYLNDTWTTTTVNTITPNTSVWCLALPTETQVTNSSTAPGGAAIVRTVSYTPDYTNCRETQIVTEPNSSTYKVTEGYQYDGFGNLWIDTVTGVGMPARVTTTTWGTTGQFLTTISNPLSQSITRGYDPTNGQLTSQTDPNYTTSNPLKTTWQYDSFARKIQENRPDGTYTMWSYNDCASWGGCVIGSHALALAHYIYNTNGSIQNDGTTWFDQVDRPLMANTMNLSGGFDRNELRYDSLGRVAQQAMPCVYSAVTTACPYWSTFSYDAINRLKQSQRPISATNSTLQTTLIQHVGRTTTVTDPQGKNTTKINLVTGSLARTQDHTGYYVNFHYDAFGSLLSVTDSVPNTLNTMTYDYGLRAFQRTSNEADLGPRSSTYDALGEVTAYSDAKGQNFSVLYDALSRPVSRTEPDLTTTWTWGNTAASFNIGKLQSVTAVGSATYSESYGYDSKTRLSTKQITIPGDTAYTYTSTYNTTTGLLDTLQYPVSTSGYQLKLQYAYQNGILQQISDVAAGTHYWTANTINPRGQYTQETLGNSVVVNHALDPVTGWPSSIQAGIGGGAALQNNSYLFDEMGNLTQRQDNNSGVTENVYYDNLYRLDHTIGDSSTAMAYDSMGRISRWGTGGVLANVNDYTTPQSGCTYYANSQLHAVRKDTNGVNYSSYCYDANGNMSMSSGCWGSCYSTSMTWTSYNQPSSITAGTSSSQFFYNADHQRYKQIASYSGSLETTFYVGGLLEKMINSSGTAYRHYIPAGNNTIVYTRLSSGTNSTYYIAKDHLGSSAVITDQSGTFLVKEKFAALGWNENSAAEQATMASVTRHEFTGHEGLDNAGIWLVNMNGRIYSPSGSMFLSPDPHIPDPGNTQSYNRYSYVNNNPLSFVDPTGFDEVPALLHAYDGSPVESSGGAFDRSGVSCYGNCGSGYWNSNLTGYWEYLGGQPGYSYEDGTEPIPVTSGVKTWVSTGGLSPITFGPSGNSGSLGDSSTSRPVVPPKKLPSPRPPAANNPAQSPNPCPGTGGNAMAFRQSAPNDPSQGYTPTHDLPPGSFTVVAPDGTPFFAPPNADFLAVYQYGQSLQNTGGRDFGYIFAHDYGGIFDFQRGNNLFNGAFSYAANYAIGIDYAAAGDPLAYAQATATARKYVGSGGQGFAFAPDAIKQGYQMAKNGGCRR
jgi:RHS repeat-associated protein